MIIDIKKALQYMIDHASPKERAMYTQICGDLADHLNEWVSDKERIAELEQHSSKQACEIVGLHERLQLAANMRSELEQENERLKEKLYDPCTEAKIINDAIEIGFKQGMERAAEIAELWADNSGGLRGHCSEMIAKAIRAEIKDTEK